MVTPPLYDGVVKEHSHPHVVARPGTAAGQRAFTVTPFARLARAHVASTVGDAMVAAAFAGSLFFSLPASDARWPVLRYLLITMLPFAVLSPLVGPLIDRLRGGHRFVVMGSAVFRALICYLLIFQIEGAGTSFFLLALCVLVGQKAYQLARSALVPTVVRSDTELVEANSKLSLLSGLSSFAGAAPAAAALKLFGPEWAVGMAMVTYLVAAVLAAQIPPARVASAPAGEAERSELRSAGIVMAGSAMGLLRACVGFLTLLIAFDFRGDRATWQLGVVAGASVLSQLAGAAVAPRIREHTTEENLLTGALAMVVFGGVLALVIGDVAGAAILGASVGFSAALGKLAFDSILQRDAPDANRGRAFARFETRFQIMWVLGALIPVWLTTQLDVGFAIVEGLALLGLASYAIGRMAWAHRSGSRQTAATAAALGIEERFTEVSGEVRDRLTKAPKAAYRKVRPGSRGGPPPATGAAGPYSVDPGAQEAYDEAYDDGYDDGGPYRDGEADDGFDELDDDLATRVDPGDAYAAHVPPRGPDPQGPTVVLDPAADDDPVLGDDPDTWPEPEWADGSEFPWEPPTSRVEPTSAYLADVPPTVHHPYPWSPDPGDADRR